MEFLTEPFDAEFVRTGALAAAVVGVVCGVVGCYVVMRGMALMADSLAHGVLPGVAIAFALTAGAAGSEPDEAALWVGALAAGLVTAAGTNAVIRRSRVREDTAAGVVFVFMLALGVVIASRVEGYSVHVAQDGQTALSLAGAVRPRAVLLDIGLPGMSGYEVCRRLRGAGMANVPMIALSGYVVDADGRLSPREVRGMPTLIDRFDRDRDGLLSVGEVPRRFRVTFSRGPVVAANPFGPVAVPRRMDGQPNPRPTAGPMWFQKMDRNQDGDVSRREFLGTDADFRRIDVDGDGLIDAKEATSIAGR